MINDGLGPVQLTAMRVVDVIAPRVTDTMPPFIPLDAPRRFLCADVRV
jgi:hypothetical protein